MSDTHLPRTDWSRVDIRGDRLAGTSIAGIDDTEFVRIAAGGESMWEATQALCFMTGANSMFTGDMLLTTGNAGDVALFAQLGLGQMENEQPIRRVRKAALC